MDSFALIVAAIGAVALLFMVLSAIGRLVAYVIGLVWPWG